MASFLLMAVGSFIMDVETNTSASDNDITNRAKSKGFTLIGFKASPDGDAYVKLQSKASNGQPGNFLYQFKIDGDDTIYSYGGTSMYKLIKACGLIVKDDKGNSVYRLGWAETFTATETDTNGNVVETVYHLPEDFIKLKARFLRKLDIAKATAESKASKLQSSVSK